MTKKNKKNQITIVKSIKNNKKVKEVGILNCSFSHSKFRVNIQKYLPGLLLLLNFVVDDTMDSTVVEIP